MNNRFQALIHVVKQKPLIAALGLGVLGTIVLLAFVQPTSTKRPDVAARPTSTSSSPKDTGRPVSTTTRLAPTVKFSTYENKAVTPGTPTTLKRYTFKTGFTDSDIQKLASNFNLTTLEPAEGQYKVVSNLTDVQSRGILAFNTQNGNWTFQSFGAHRLPGDASTNINNRVEQYLSSIGAIDSSVKCPFYYERSNSGTVTQNVECHRSWEEVGLPIFSTVGVINIAENRRLSDLRLGGINEVAPPDPTIINVSNGIAGRSRPDEYNTITVSLSGDRITAIASNIRPVQIVDTVQSSDLLSPAEVLAQLMAQKAQFSLTIPAGSGATSLSSVYPGNLASAQKATITDLMVTYLENPIDVPQKVMVPMYIAKGTAELSSGYTVRFHQIIPALKSGLSSLPSQTLIAGISTRLLSQSSGVKLGSFDPTLTTTLQPTAPQAIPTTPVNQPPQTSSECIPVSQGDSLQSQDFTIIVPGMGEMIITRPIGMTNTFYLKSATFDLTTISRVRDLMQIDLASQQFEINIARAVAANPSLLSSTTPNTEALYSLYAEINAPGINRGVCGMRQMNQAPLAPTCIEEQLDNKERMLAVIDKTTQSVMRDAQNGSLSAKSTQADVFPAPIPSNMHFLYLSPPHNAQDPEISDATDINDCYISGTSPIMYIYSEKPEQVSIHVPAYSTYTDPMPINGVWNANVTADSSLHVDGVDRNKLYYEYDPSKVHLIPTAGGFTIKTNDVEYFVQNKLKVILGLNETESRDLITEVNRVLSKSTHTPYVIIRFADSTVLDKELPLITDKTLDHISRIHLLVKPSNTSEFLPEPILQKVTHAGFNIVEIGARAL